MARLIMGFILLGMVKMAYAQNTPDIYMQALVDNPNPYAGQPIVYSLRIYDSLASEGLEIAYPNFNGFGQESPTTSPPYSQVIDGKTYTVYTQDIILYPNSDGTFVFDPSALRVPESPFQSEQILSSTQVAVTVRALPLNNPLSFRNAVGDFSMSATLDKSDLQQGDVVTLTVSITGQGNLAQVLAPQIIFAEAQWRVFERPPQFVGDTPLNGTKTFTWTLIPQQSGIQTLPNIEWSYFNLQRAEFVTLSQNALSLNVMGDGQLMPTVIAPQNTRATPPLFVLANLAITTGDAMFTPNILFWLLPLLLPIGLWLMRRPTRQISITKVTPRTNNQFDQALRQLLTLPPQEATEKIGELLNQVIAQHATRAKQTPQTWLAQRTPSQQKRIQQCLQQAQSARYAPLTPSDVQLLAKNVRSIVLSLESNTASKGAK
jgi:hypothetical protein